MNIKKLFTTFQFHKWRDLWKNNPDSVIKTLSSHGYNFYEFVDFYKKNGRAEEELVERLILESIQNKAFNDLTDNQKAFMALDLLKELRTQMIMEEKALQEKKDV